MDLCVIKIVKVLKKLVIANKSVSERGKCGLDGNFIT